MGLDYRKDAPAFVDFDSYNAEASAFERDVYTLVLNTLNAGLKHLAAVANKELADFESALNKTRDVEIQDHLMDEDTGVKSEFGEQERCLLNMALVALTSRLTHTLRKMAQSAEHFRPRKGKYANGDDSEFDRLWKEYGERFSIDFEAHAHRIAFIEPCGKSATKSSITGGGEPV